ncbi:MAG TPA: ABC transporter permease [Candidatus Binatus sp.]|jgi:predicted permease|nr:ABC transporter permease [Candidatus Binatus sp.]
MVRHRLKSRLSSIFRRQAAESDLQRELQSHLDLETAEQHESGLPADQAYYAARRAFGNPTLVTEDVRESWSLAWLEHFFRDLRYGARSLLKSPGFSAVAVLTLALGIGANTAIFSAIDVLMLRPLPFSSPDQLVRIYSIKTGIADTFGNPDGPSAPDVRDFAQRSHSFQKIVVYDTWRKNVSFGDLAGEPEQMRVGLVPAAYFEILDVKPIAGRLFTEDENQVGKNFVAAISAGLWKDRFAADPSILGRTIRINGEPYTIVAVMPDLTPERVESGLLDSPKVWTPFAFSDVWSETSRGERGYLALARLKPGVPLEQAQADLSVIAAALAAAHPVDQGVSVSIKKLADTRAGSLRPMLFLLMGAVCLILLIACVNLANLLLARNSARQRELAVRTALGSARRGLIRQLLAETLLLSLAGAAAGLLLAKAGLASVMMLHPANLPQLEALEIDWRVLTFTLSISLVTALLFGLAPAITGTRLNLVDALKQGGRSGTAGKGGKRMRNLLVATEMAMSLMLLVAASLVVQSLARLNRQSLGIRQDHLLKGHFYVPGVRYPDPSAIARFCDQFANKIRALPGVIDATVTTIYPPNNGWTQMLGIPGHPATRIQDIPAAQFGVADAHFRTTLAIPLVRGRDFAESDIATSPPVALVTEEFRRRYFPSQDPLGQKIHIGPPQFMQLPSGAGVTDSSDVTIVGIIGDFRNNGLALPPEPQIVVLYSQHPLVNYGFKDIVIRTASEPSSLAPAIRRQLHDLDSDMPFAEVQTMEALVEEESGGERFTAVLLSLFAAAGLVLAIVGIYGVVSFAVAQRNQELALRIALGATRANVLWLVLKQGLEMATIGAAIGLLGACATQKLTSSLLFGISPVDPATFAGGAALLLAVAAMASAIPGVRVMRIDPSEVLRQD